MKRIYLFLIALVALTTIPTVAQANGPWIRAFQDYKFPSQAAIEHQSWTTPAAASATLLKSGAALSSVAATTITSFVAQPDFARNITLTPTGTTASVQAGTAVVSGLNIFGKAITENFSISNQQSTATTGNKAFASVTSVVFPIASASGATLSIGAGTKMGANRCLTNAGDYVFSEYGGVYDATRGTMAVSATAVESNTFIPNSAADAAHNLDLFFVQNYRCYPGQ